MAVLERSRTAVGQNYRKATQLPVIRIYLLFLDFACQKVRIKWSQACIQISWFEVEIEKGHKTNSDFPSIF